MKLDQLKQLYGSVLKSLGYKVERNKNQFASQLEHMMLLDDINRKAMAERAGCSPAYITKVLRGDANFTIESMTRLADAANAELCLHLTKKGMTTRIFDVYESVNVRSEPVITEDELASVLSWQEYAHCAGGRRVSA